MEIFKFLYTAKFNNKRFCVFSNEHYSVYILEILNDKSLCYPQYEDYIGFFNKFQEFSSGKVRLELGSNDKSVNNSKVDKEFLHNNKFSFAPKVIKDGILITALTALFLSGCAYPSTVQASNKVSDEERIESNIDKANDAGFETEYLSDLNIYITKSYIESDTDNKFIICTTNDEMKTYFPDKNQNPTYDDVINTLQQNKNIPDKFKEQYIKALNEMKKVVPEIDLFLLNLNFERMVVEEREDLGGVAGKFLPKTGETYYEYDVSNRTIVHELAHALLGGEFDLGDGVKVEKSFRIPETQWDYNTDDSKAYYYTLFHASMLEEYIADKLAEISTGEVPESSNPYAPTDYHFEMYRLACNYSIQDLINYGPIGFAKSMTENDIDYPISFMDDEDYLISRYNIYDYDEEFSKYGVTINSIPIEFFNDWAGEKFERNEKEIEERAINYINGTSFTDGVSFEYKSEDGNRTVDSSTPEELTELVQETLLELDKNTTSSIKDFFEDWFK